MYPGHFAAGLALKVCEPKSSTLGLMIGVGLLDLLFAVFVLFSLEGGAIGSLHIPWSHSLLMTLVWSAGYAALFWRQGARIMAIMGVAVFSHWLLDLLSHRPDIQWWPGAPGRIGLGQFFGGLGGWFELLTAVLGLAFYVVWARRPRNCGRRWPITVLMVTAMYAAEVAVIHPFR